MPRPDSVQDGTDDAWDYVMKYRYLYVPQNPDGSGNIELKANVEFKARLKSLSISVNWVDAEGKILESKNFYFSGSNKG